MIHQQTDKLDLSQFDNEMIAVVLKLREREFVLRGRANFQQDDRLGRILRIPASDCQTDIVISENQWEGRIIPDFEHGCRYCFVPESILPTSSESS